MIERMKKLTFLVTPKEYDSFVASLRKLGVVHVEQLQEGTQSESLQEAIDLAQRYRAAIEYVSKATPSPDAFMAKLSGVDTPLALLAKVEELRGAQQDMLMLVPRLVNERDEICLSWTERQPSSTAEVYEMIEACKKYDELEAQITALEAEQNANALALAQICASKLPLLEQGESEAKADIDLQRVLLSPQDVAEGNLRLMLGWARADRTEELTAYLDSKGIYYEMTDPEWTDNVPVEVTEDGFSKLFLPILKMYSLPNYREIDPTVFFAPFFMLFFGLCLGDAGYGFLVLLVGLFIMIKAKGGAKDYGKLAAILGTSTLVCGLLMGTVFGIDLSQQDWALLAPVKHLFISDGGMGKIMGYSPMMVISVAIGLVQVLLGMVLKGAKAWKNYGFGYAIGTLSWVVALVGIVLFAALPAMGCGDAKWAQWTLAGLIGVACLGIFLYNNPAAYKNPITGPLLNLGSGVYSVYSMATGLLGDLLSYIRLFALGLTGGVLGGVFNSLAFDMTDGMSPMIKWLPMLVILLFGHGITFALSLISAFVHPMRLIFVEFFKNADFEGGGRPYQPFKEAINQ